MNAQSLTVARGVLLPALALATRVVERRNTVPILQNILLQAGEGMVKITGTDLDAEITVSRKCGLDSAETAHVTLPSANLHEIVRKLPEGCDVRLARESEGMWQVSAGRSRFRLPFLPASDFPTMAACTFQHEFRIEAHVLRHMLETVAFAISTEETRYYLNGVHWHVDEAGDAPRLVSVATDGHRLATTSCPLPEGAAGMPGIIIPRKTVDIITRILPEQAGVRIGVSDSKIRIRVEDGDGAVSLVSKLIDGTFPDYRRVVPQGNPHHFPIDRAALAAAIGRVTTIASERGHGVKFTFADGELKLTSRSPDTGDAEETLSLSGGPGDLVEIGFNGRYCLDLLNTAVSDAVTFELGDAGAPALVRPGEGGPVSFVLMPMRI